jgi:hypothetical protein
MLLGSSSLSMWGSGLGNRDLTNKVRSSNPAVRQTICGNSQISPYLATYVMGISKAFASPAASSVVRHLPVLASRRQGKRRECHELAVGGKEDARRCIVPSHPRNHQPKPVNAGNGAPEPARHGAIHVRVDTGGEDHCSSGGSACKSRNPSVAVGVTILHLSMAGRCHCTGPFIVFLFCSVETHNGLLNADAQHHEAALLQLLRAG